MRKQLCQKLNSERGISWLIAIMLVLVIILAVTSMIPSYRKYQEQGMRVACGTALDTARRQLAANFMLNGFENESAEKAKEFVTYVMNGWDDLCPAGGDVYIVPKADSPMDWEIICGLHCSDSKLRTRLNAYNVREQLKEVLGTLTEREQKVLRLRFGLDDGRARTLEEVGKEFNVTRERIRQIEAKALRKLRHPSRSRKLKDYLD